MVFISSSTSNEWPQNQIVDDQKSLMASTARLMDKSEQQQQQQQQQEALRCPRCDSSNTKFCYYNNYSLSQPRHFCKACKRYWTRGGTLRNVPVGGGCRKNKRVKRLTAGVDGTSSVTSSASSANTNPPSQPQIDLSSTSNHVSPLFYGLHTSPSDMNLSFSRFSSGISNVESVTGFDVIQPQLNALGLGFSSGILSNGVDGSDYRPGYNSSKQIHDIVSSNSLLSSYSIFGTPSSSSTATVTAPPTITSLLASKFINGGSKETRVPNHFHFMETFDPDVGVIGNEETEVDLKGVKEEAQNKLEWNVGNYQNQSDQTRVYDPSVYWNSLGVSWHDPANIGSSLTSLI